MSLAEPMKGYLERSVHRLGLKVFTGKSPRLSVLVISCCFFIFAFLFYGCETTKDGYYSEVPVRLNSGHLPCIPVFIQGKKHFAIVDTASKLELAIDKDVLSGIDKFPLKKTIEQGNLLGEVVVKDLFQIPRLRLGKFAFENLTAVEKGPPVTFKDGVRVFESNEGFYNVALGKPFIEKRNFLMDVKRKRVIFTDKLERTKKRGYNPDLFARVPASVKGKYVKIKGALNSMEVLCTIDSASTVSFIDSDLLGERSPDCKIAGLPAVTFSSFLVNGNDFGRIKLVPIECNEKVKGKFEVILGVDFIAKHSVYFDFKDEAVYVFLEQSKAEDLR